MSRNILFGYGNIGKIVASELKLRGEEVVVASRKGEQIDGFESIACDATNRELVLKSTQGASRIIVTIGLPYKLNVWQKDWPVIIDNVIAAAKQNGSKIAFFDNVYLYGPSPLPVPFTEDSPRNPDSKKGQVRLLLVQRLEAAMAQGVQVVIGRSADFYGPGTQNSMITMAIEAMVVNKNGYYLGNPGKLHSFAYAQDTGYAFTQLILADDCYGQTWHLPVAQAVKGEEIMRMASWAAGEGKDAKWSAMSQSSVRFMKLFIPPLRELQEMMYQFENDYVLDCTKYVSRFRDVKLTPYAEGVAKTVDYAKAHKKK